MIKAGLYGFGRFGLHVLKYWLEQRREAAFQLAYLSDPNLDLSQVINLIENDRYVKFPRQRFTQRDGHLLIQESGYADLLIEYQCCAPEQISWAGKPELFLEGSGLQNKKPLFSRHLHGNTRLILLSATCWEADQTLVYGFNQQSFDPRSRSVSYGSCTVNAFMPLADFLHRQFGVRNADVSVVHNVSDYHLPEFDTLERHACSLEISAPRLLPFLNADNFLVRYLLVPYSGPSAIDFRFELAQPPNQAQLLKVLQEACAPGGELHYLYGMNAQDEGPAAYKFTGKNVELLAPELRLRGSSLYLSGYFDNENSACRYFDMAQHIAKQWQQAGQLVSKENAA